MPVTLSQTFVMNSLINLEKVAALPVLLASFEESEHQLAGVFHFNPDSSLDRLVSLPSFQHGSVLYHG